MGFLGLNGAGKSTTLHIISCQLVPTSGNVTVAGFNVLENSREIRKRIGYLPEIPPLYHEMTVRSYLEFVARLKGISRAEIKKRIAEVEERIQIGHVSKQVIGTLSAGYKQRVGIAQSVIHKPELIILDEPFAGLDPVQIVEMRKMIRELGGDYTVLLSSHLLFQIHQTCDRILVIQQGEIIAQGTEEELAQKSKTDTVFEIELRGDQELIEKILKEHDSVTNYWGDPLADDIYKVTVNATSDISEGLSASFVQAGLGLRGLRRSEVELESVFVQLTRGHTAEEPQREPDKDEHDKAEMPKETSEKPAETAEEQADPEEDQQS